MTRSPEKPVALTLDEAHGLIACEACGALAGFECEHERNERAQGYTTRRPRGCLNAYDPATSEWPEGF